MAKQISIINILTYQLPFELTNQIYNEFQNRLREATFLIETYKTYKPLEDNIKAVELFLSLSIFHRRVITNLDAAVKFYGTVTKKSQAEIIKIGNYNLTGDERNKLLAVVLSYNNLLRRFSIPPAIMEYLETRDFLKKLITLKSIFDNAEDSKNQNRRDQNNNSQDELPF